MPAVEVSGAVERLVRVAADGVCSVREVAP
jgi:hypothetical protein